MDKQSDRYIRPLFPNHLGKHQQVVVMDPDDVPVLDDLQYFFRIQAVNFYIGFPGDLAVGNILGEIVKQWPEGIA